MNHSRWFFYWKASSSRKLSNKFFVGEFKHVVLENYEFQNQDLQVLTTILESQEQTSKNQKFEEIAQIFQKPKIKLCCRKMNTSK